VILPSLVFPALNKAGKTSQVQTVKHTVVIVFIKVQIIVSEKFSTLGYSPSREYYLKGKAEYS
jgi:hypothetical protein